MNNVQLFRLFGIAFVAVMLIFNIFVFHSTQIIDNNDQIINVGSPPSLSSIETAKYYFSGKRKIIQNTMASTTEETEIKEKIETETTEKSIEELQTLQRRPLNKFN
jgi:hypothetical protein